MKWADFKFDIGALRPDDADSRKALHGLKAGDHVLVKVRRPRNMKQHRLYWALMGMLADNTNAYTKDDIHEIMKRRVGHCKVVQTAKGPETITLPTDVGSMSRADWEDYFEKVRTVVLEDIWPHLTDAELMAEIEAALT